MLYGSAGFLAVALGFLGKSVYRDFIVSNQINDFGIEGFLPSYFYVAGFSLLLMIRPVRFPVLIISIVTLASLLFEIKQSVSSGHIDFIDIAASIAGGLTAFLIFKLIDNRTI